MDNSIIKNKQLQFTHNETTFRVKIKYDTSPFGVGDKSFWQTKLYQVNDERLLIPLTYSFTQSRGFIAQIKSLENIVTFVQAEEKRLTIKPTYIN